MVFIGNEYPDFEKELQEKKDYIRKNPFSSEMAQTRLMSNKTIQTELGTSLAIGYEGYFLHPGLYDFHAFHVVENDDTPDRLRKSAGVIVKRDEIKIYWGVKGFGDQLEASENLGSEISMRD